MRILGFQTKLIYKCTALLCIIVVTLSLCSCSGRGDDAVVNAETKGELTSDNKIYSTNSTSKSFTEEGATVKVISSTITGSNGTSENREAYCKDIKNAMKYTDVIAAYVNGKPIYRSYVLISKAGRDETISDSLDSLNENEGKDYYKKYYKNEKEVLDEVIDQEVVGQEAKRLGMSFNEKDIAKDAKSQVASLKKLENNEFSNWLDAFGYTEEEYLINIEVPSLEKRSLYNQYIEKVCPSESFKDNDSKNAAFSAHVKELKKSYNIKIISSNS